jgi:Saxitoxin biosynthesis operon protein SxtJ
MVKVVTHESFDARFEVKRGSDRSFGLIIAGFFALLGLWPLLHLQMPRWGLLVVAVVVFALAAALPVVLHPFNLVWFRIGLLLHKVVTPVIMGVLFYLVVTPIGMAMRLFGKKPLPLKPDRAVKSYWIERDPPGPTPQSMKHQF